MLEYPHVLLHQDELAAGLLLVQALVRKIYWFPDT
jgi:hypothetical protein